MKPTTQSYYESVIRSAVATVVQQLDDVLDLPQLARRAALAPLHFHHVFRGMLGETPRAFHRRLRLERAAFRLLAEDTPVTRIALESGYETHESFTRAFRQAFAAAPSEMRSRNVGPASTCAVTARFELPARSGVHYPVTQAQLVHLHFNRGVSDMEVTIENLTGFRLAALRHVGPYNTISHAFGQLGAVAGRAGLFGAEPPTMIAVYHDDPESTAPDALRSDAALTVPEGSTIPAPLTEIRLPAGRYARTTHIGPYSQLGDVWARLLGEWLPASGEQLADGLSFEIYRNDPTTTAQSDLRTDLFVPVT